ncbi:HNH endonuclease family protein [Pseudomonas sp. YY-1]|uniref:HNH endonuclease family protein n=1 Tax=Pseudomonas sp. YY-1 TaxID=2058659 RepID=UPI0012FF041F|nr:HNH endonuclease family protein [Pseudomonas sp. YY-1]
MDNQLLGEMTDSSLVARSRRFMDTPWRTASALQFEAALAKDDGVRFAHYWFYKLDFVLWYEQQADHEFWGNFRFTAKNSVEHISPQNPQATDTNTVSKEWLDRFGNLALVSRSINSEYGNLPFNEKRQRFLNKREYEKRPDSLKLDLIYSNVRWGEAAADAHQSAMVTAFRNHYLRDFNIG